RQGPRLTERLHRYEFQAPGNLIETRLGAALPPQRDALPQAPGEEDDRDEAARVEQHLGPAGNVPEGVAERHGRRRHEGSNDTMGNMAATAEYGSVSPATTSSNLARKAPPPRPRSTRSRNSSTSSDSSSARRRWRRRAGSAPAASRAAGGRRWRPARRVGGGSRPAARRCRHPPGPAPTAPGSPSPRPSARSSSRSAGARRISARPSGPARAGATPLVPRTH